ncbi:MAG: glycosyltransferase family 4 protein [Acidobacteria bacterium]|nr:glycosyltransferase family 4 protein [Acidobacteriota bacterium]
MSKEITHRLALRQFDGFLSVGERNREYLIHCGVPPKLIFSSPHFVDNEWFAARAAAARKWRDSIRGQWLADESIFVVLFVGKFIPKKRPLDLVKALGLLVRKGLRMTAVFVGAGELEKEMRDLVEEQKVQARFEGFRNQTELPQFYASADTLVLPSDGGETWGLVVNEAMACGLPAIVSDAVGCASDLIDEGKTGFTFPKGDYVQLANHLDQLATMKAQNLIHRKWLADKVANYSIQAAMNGILHAVTERCIKKL